MLPLDPNSPEYGLVSAWRGSEPLDQDKISSPGQSAPLVKSLFPSPCSQSVSMMNGALMASRDLAISGLPNIKIRTFAADDACDPAMSPMAAQKLVDWNVHVSARTWAVWCGSGATARRPHGSHRPLLPSMPCARDACIERRPRT